MASPSAVKNEAIAVVVKAPWRFGGMGTSTSMRAQPSATSTGWGARIAVSVTPCPSGLSLSAPRTNPSSSAGERCWALRTTRTASGRIAGTGSCFAASAATMSFFVTRREPPAEGLGPMSTEAAVASAFEATSPTWMRLPTTTTSCGGAAEADRVNAADASAAKTVAVKSERIIIGSASRCGASRPPRR